MASIILTVDIETANGVFVRSGDPYSIGDTEIRVESGIITYPDRRVKNFRLHITVDGANWYYRDYKPAQSKKANFSYANTGEVIEIVAPIAGFGELATYDPTVANTNKTERDPNRVLVSTVYKPRQLYGRNAHYIGNSSNDEVLAFRANAKEVSSGQFGQFPLYAFCRNSIWAMEVGEGDVAFKRISAVSINDGIISKHAVVNVDTMIVYATKEGVKTIPPSAQPLSYEIQNSDEYHNDDILNNLDDNSRFASFIDKKTGRKELWISTSRGIYAYSFTMKRWFRLSGKRNFFLDLNGELIGGSDDVLHKEAGTYARVGSFVTAPISFGDGDVMKKFRRILLRKGGTERGYEVIATNHTDYDFTLTNNTIDRPVYTTDDQGVMTPLYSLVDDGITHPVYSIDAEYEERYAHRMRIRRTDIDLGFYGGYGGIYAQFYEIGQKLNEV